MNCGRFQPVARKRLNGTGGLSYRSKKTKHQLMSTASLSFGEGFCDNCTFTIKLGEDMKTVLNSLRIYF